MLKISNTVQISLSEIELTAIRAQGAGGQHINKVSSAIHLRFNICQSSLPSSYQSRLLAMNDYRITEDGVIIIKAQRYKSQEQNKADALQRLTALLKRANKSPIQRRKTKPPKSSVKKRLDNKTSRGKVKKLRQPPSEH